MKSQPGSSYFIKSSLERTVIVKTYKQISKKEGQALKLFSSVHEIQFSKWLIQVRILTFVQDA